MKNIKSIALLTCLIAISYKGMAQTTGQKIGANPTIKDASALLELESTNKGVLMPRVALTGTTDVTTIASPANSLTVFNTATAGTAPNAVTPGYYYWSTADAKWLRLQEKESDLRLIGNNNHITQDAGWDYNGTSVGTGTDNIGIGRGTLSKNYTGRFNVAMGSGSLINNTTGESNVAIGHNTMFNSTTASGNTAIGHQVLMSTTGGSNVGTGIMALWINTAGSYNVANGAQALMFNTTGDGNTAMGAESLFFNTVGSYNTGMGSRALYANISGSYNNAIGRWAGYQITTGNNNTVMGFLAGRNITTGSNNVAIGSNTNVADPTADNQININNAIFGVGGLVGINTAAPSNTLHVKATANPLRLEGLQTGLNTDNLVVADVNGVLKTVAPSALTTNSWSLTGNAGTNPSTNFLGTTDNQALVFKSNNAEAMQIIPSGNVGVGVAPDDYSQHKLQVNSIRFGKPSNGSNTHYSFAQAPADFTNALAQKPFTLVAGNAFLDRSELLLGGSTNMNNEAAVQRIRFFTTPTKDTALGTERMVLDRDGNLGIGTSTPTNTLHISATANPIRLEGLQTGLLTDNVVVADANGVLKTVGPGIGDLRLVGNDNHITQDAGVGGNGSSVGIGANNIGIGASVLQANVNGSENVAIGNNTLTKNTRGSGNIALGYVALQENTTGFGNTAIGERAMLSNTTGYHNTASGTEALRQNTEGTSNTASGTYSLASNTIGYDNTAIGQNALGSNTIGNNNTAIGYYAMASKTTGDSNTALGNRAGNTLTTGSNNLAIGYNTNVASPTDDNQMNIGNTIFGTGMNGSVTAPAGLVGINVTAPSNTLHVKATANPLRLEGLQTGLATDVQVVADANGVLKTIAASTSAAIITKTADYSALTTDETILVNATSGLVKITLPNATTVKGKKYNVKKIDASVNGAQVISAGGTIDGNAAATGVTGTLSWQGWVFQSDGTNWYIISRI